LRNLVTAALAACLIVVAMAVLGFGVGVATASAATPPVNPKVVIIVGPVGGSTSSYKSDADSAAAEASKYTTNVVKIYTPTATWTKVKAALQGASIVIYMGHGNGWPSPYAPFQTKTKDGLGLNATAGTDNTKTTYYGESYLAAEVHLAPNAVVLLAHLCYSAGNSESFNPDPTLAVAKQRVDNMAAGWIAAGAGTVVAEVYSQGMWGGIAWYVQQLFTTHQTVDDMWRANPNFNDHVLAFPSVRSAGNTVEMDPDGVNKAPFGRAIVGKLGLLTQDVTGARYAATDFDPATLTVPGAASVAHDGAGLYADPALTPDGGTGLAPATLPLDTKLRVDGAYPAVGTPPVPVYAVHTLDGASSGFMSAADLTPRDSLGPNIWTADDGTGAFSPNADGSQDVFDVTGQISESASWTVTFSNGAGHAIKTVTGVGRTYDATWNGIVSGSPVADGAYPFTITAVDSWGNPEGSRSGVATVDTVAPEFGAAASTALLAPTFSPNGDGVGDTIAFAYSTDESGFVDATIRDASHAVVRRFATSTSAGPGSVTWLGDTDAAGTASDGTYSIDLSPRDEAGNVGAPDTRTVAVYGALSAVKASARYFYPQDNDKYAKTTTLSFTLVHAATVLEVVTDGAGHTVYTRYADTALAAGTYPWAWNGKTAAGAFVARGAYTVTVSATDGTLSSSQSATFYADAFHITPSDTTPARGQSISVTVITAEALRSNPRLTIRQPGHAARTVTMTKVSSTTYRITVKLAASGKVGSLVLTVSGRDHANKVNTSSVSIALH